VRKRSYRKRQAILAAAYVLFSEKGFERTSMSEICARAGGSKATIYSYFDSKEELFVECMFYLAENYLEGIICDLQSPADDLLSVLQDFGENFLRLVCSPEMVAARRLMIAEAGRAGIGHLFYEKLVRIRQQVTSFLSIAMTEGKLRGDDADLAAGQLLALLEMELFEPLLLCAGNGHPDEPAIVLAAERAVGPFLRAYTREAR
jgi:AcrR family transcriptional regulator